MKVKDLIEKLSNINPEADVIVSIDGEGNSYNEVHCVSNDYNWNPLWCEIGFKTLRPDLEEQGYEESDTMLDGKDCVVLSP